MLVESNKIEIYNITPIELWDWQIQLQQLVLFSMALFVEEKKNQAINVKK